MGRGATTAAGNVYYQSRIKAASWNEKLSSREGASEELGISVDTVKAVELGLHKHMPVDLCVLMADLYKAPELLNHYCKNECPVGCDLPLAVELNSIELTTVRLIKALDDGSADIKRQLLDIAEDGVISDDEMDALDLISEQLNKLSERISELTVIVKSAKKHKE